MILPTTSVGSFPKPEYLTKARAQAARGQMSREELAALEERATRESIAMQEEVGIDILVDGEMYRGDMVAYFAESIEGMEEGGLVRSYGNRYYRKPIVTGALRRPGPLTVERFRFAQSLTSKPIKAILTGPYTMMDWSFNEHYATRADLTLAFAELIHGEVADLEKAGAKYIQIDEPAISTRPEEIDLAVEAMGIVTKGIKAKTLTHICYGRFEQIYPKMLEIPVDHIDLEMSNSGFDMLELMKKHPFTKEIGLGVVDSHSHVIESPDLVAERIRAALCVIPVEKVYVDPDCGLKTRSWEETRGKLEAIVQGARIVRQELGVKV